MKVQKLNDDLEVMCKNMCTKYEQTNKEFEDFRYSIILDEISFICIML